MDASFWDRFAFVYDLAMKVQGDAAKDAAADVAALVGEGACVLDAACGTGTFALAVAACSPHVSVEACDYAEKMVSRTRAKAARAGLANVRCSVGDVCDIAFADASFDVAIAANVLHLLDDPARALSELARVVKPGGLIALPTYVNAEAKSAERFVGAAGKLGFSPKQAWTRESYVAFLEDADMQVESSRFYSARQPLCLALCRKGMSKPPSQWQGICQNLRPSGTSAFGTFAQDDEPTRSQLSGSPLGSLGSPCGSINAWCHDRNQPSAIGGA